MKPISFIWIFLLTLAACQPPAPSTPQPTLAAQPTALAPASPTPAPSTSTPAPTLQPVILQPVTFEPAPCSPLAASPLETLTKIISQPFTMPRQLDDGAYKDDAHHGLDLAAYTAEGKLSTGLPVHAAIGGTLVALLPDRPPYGNALIIETPYAAIPPTLIQSQSIPPGHALYTLYAHLQNVESLQPGDIITCGQPLAQIGMTGATSGPHLHFETRYGLPGQTFPGGMAYYRADTSEAERANYQRWRMSGEFVLFDPLLLLVNE